MKENFAKSERYNELKNLLLKRRVAIFRKIVQKQREIGKKEVFLHFYK